MTGATRTCAAGYSVTLPLSRHRLLSGVSERFFRRVPAQATRRGLVLLSPSGGCPAIVGVWVAVHIEVRVAMGTALPGILIPVFWSGNLIAHLHHWQEGSKWLPVM